MRKERALSREIEGKEVSDWSSERGGGLTVATLNFSAKKKKS